MSAISLLKYFQQSSTLPKLIVVYIFSLASGARDYRLSTVMPGPGYEATSITTANKELINPKRIQSVERMNTPVDATHDGLYSVGAHQEDDCL